MSHSKKTIDKINWLDTSLYAFWRGCYAWGQEHKGNEKINMSIVVRLFADKYKIDEDEHSLKSLRERLSRVIYNFDDNPFKCD